MAIGPQDAAGSASLCARDHDAAEEAASCVIAGRHARHPTAVLDFRERGRELTLRAGYNAARTRSAIA
jgi:hypothetical protein